MRNCEMKYGNFCPFNKKNYAFKVKKHPPADKLLLNISILIKTPLSY